MAESIAYRIVEHPYPLLQTALTPSPSPTAVGRGGTVPRRSGGYPAHWDEGKSNCTGERFRHSLPGVRVIRSDRVADMAHLGRTIEALCLSIGVALA